MFQEFQGKKKIKKMLLRRSTFAICKPSLSLSSYSTAPAADLSASQQLETFRTNETKPTNHHTNIIGKFYRHHPDLKRQLFSHGGIPKLYEKQLKTFGESCLMVREPALEIMHYIKNTDFTKPAVRYVVYGKDGVGKSLTIAHVLHYGIENDFLLVHVPWVPNWFKRPKEKANSTTRPDCIDLPIDAAAWLILFKTQNSNLLAKLDLKCSKDYVWSIRESTPAGSTLVELIDHGIARIKFACDTVAILIEEIKRQSTDGKCKTLVAIDGYNAFFHPHTRILTDNKVKVTPDQVTLTQPFKSITSYDWCNGVCVMAVDRIASTTGFMESELPRYLLDKQGFEHLDPFVPIRVQNYTDIEYDSCIEYYLNRKWIQNAEDGFDKELKFLSGSNPYRLMDLCKSL